MPEYRLRTDGDVIEREYCDVFILRDFPSYEVFWQRFVTPLSRRPENIQLKDHGQLAAAGRTDLDICLAQLHYSILLHLVRAYDLLHQEPVKADQLLFGLTALCGAQDIAFELLERFQNPKKYPAWPIMNNGKLQDPGMKAQKNWQNSHDHPLQDIRDYRNRLVHGRMPPTIVWTDHRNNVLLHNLPRIGLESQYFDWRKVTLASTAAQMPHGDFADAKQILAQAWQSTTAYLEGTWKTYLLPHLQ